MAAQRKFEIIFLGDTKSFDKSIKQVGDGVDKSRKRFSGLGKVAAGAFAGGIVVAGAAMKGFAEKAMESEKSQARMETQLKALGINFDKHSDTIGRVIQKHSELSGFDDEDLQDSFTSIVRVTGDVNKALELNNLAMDIARARSISVAKAGELVGKVAGGNTGILSRYGIKIKEGATAQEALAEAQKKFGGQAAAYGKTAAGGQEKFQVALENLQEVLGAKLLPIITKVITSVSKFVTELQNGTGAGGKFISWIKNAIKDITAFANKVDDALGISKHVWPAIVKLVEGVATTVRGMVKVVKGLIEGDFSDVWDGMKAIVEGAWKAVTAVVGLAITGIVNLIKGSAGAFIDAGEWVIDQIAKGIKTVTQGLANVGEWIKDRVVGLIKSVAGAFEGVGTWVITQITGGIKTVTDGLSNVGEWIKDRVVGFVKSVPGAFAAAGVWVITQIAGGIKTVTDGLGNVGEWLLGRVGAFVRAIPGGFANIGEWIITNLVGGIKTVTEGLGNLGEWILGRLQAAGEWVAARAGNIGKAIIRAVAAGLTGAVGFVKTVIRTIARLIDEGIPNSINLPGPLPNIDLPNNPITDTLGLAQGGYLPAGQSAIVNEVGRERITALPGGGVAVEQASLTAAGLGGGGAPTVHIENAHMGSQADVILLARELGWRLQTT